MPLFRPSFVLVFTIKFDEAFTKTPVAAPTSVEDRVEGWFPSTDKKTGIPALLSSGPGVFRFPVVPRAANVELPGYRQAGQFGFTIDFRDLPIDPRTVRAGAVELHVGTISDGEASAGYRGQKSQGSLRSILKPTSESGKANLNTLCMVGVFDDWEVHHTEKGSTVNIKGRDLRGLLLDVPINVKPGMEQQLLDALDLDAPIDDVVQQILDFSGLFAGILTTINPAEWPDGIVPSPSPKANGPRHRQGAKGNRKSARSTPQGSAGGMSFWDLIIKYCYLVGAIPTFVGRELHIRPARTIYDQIRGPVDPVLNPTPFTDGKLRVRDLQTDTPINPGLKYRKLVYGRDMKTFTFTRKFTGHARPKMIRCTGHDPRLQGSDAMIEGVWPPPTAPTGAVTTTVAPGGNIAQTDIQTFPTSGIHDVERLTDMAHSLYEEMARQECGGSFETNNLASFGGDNEDPDLLRLRPGDGVEFLTDTRALSVSSPLMSTLTQHARSSAEEEIERITERLGNRELARVIVGTSRGQYAELQRFFRIQTVKFSWGSDGIKIHADFQNYFVPRNQIGQASPSVGWARKKS